MQVTTIEREAEYTAFVRAAMEAFKANPQWHSWTDGDIEPGVLMALRYTTTSVVVFRLTEDAPRLYENSLVQSAENR